MKLPQNQSLDFKMHDSELDSENITFKVRFGVGASFKKIAPNSFSFHGKGSLVVGRQTTQVSGKRHRPFWFGVPEDHSFLICDVINARAVRRYVRFDVLNQPQGPLLQVGFIARNRKEAAKIVGLLPRKQSEQFAKDLAERSDYQERLEQLTPRAWVTPSIVGVNILVFLLMCLSGVGVITPNAQMAIHWGSNYGPLTIVDRQWWRLFTAMFIHFGLLHVTFNMAALYQSGRLVERLFGSVRYAALYVFAGLTGSLVSILWHPMVNSAGASGAIFGVFGALLVFMLDPRNAVPSSVMKEHRYSTAVFIGFNLANGFSHSGIDNGAHIGGLLGGMAMGYLLARPLNESARQSANVKGFAGATVLGLAILGLLTYQLDRSRELTKAEIAAEEDVKNNHGRAPDPRPLFHKTPMTTPALYSAAPPAVKSPEMARPSQTGAHSSEIHQSGTSPDTLAEKPNAQVVSKNSNQPLPKAASEILSFIEGMPSEDQEECLATRNRKPATSTKPDTLMVQVRQHGLSCFFDRDGELYDIRMDAPFMGSAAGVRIGDDIHRVHELLGRPTNERSSLQNPSTLFYKMDQSITLRIQLSNRDIIESMFVVRS